MIKDLLITPLDIIETPGGNVMHAVKMIHRVILALVRPIFQKLSTR